MYLDLKWGRNIILKSYRQLLKAKHDMLMKMEEGQEFEDEDIEGDPISEVNKENAYYSEKEEGQPNVGLRKIHSMKGNVDNENININKSAGQGIKQKVANIRNNDRNNSGGGERGSVILTSGNGLGLWCHAKKEASISMYNDRNQQQPKLPPIQSKQNAVRPKRSANSQRRIEPKQSSRGVNNDVDQKVELSLVQMLEKQVTELSTQIDKAEIDRNKMEYEYNRMKREYDKIRFETDQVKQENEELNELSWVIDEKNR